MPLSAGGNESGGYRTLPPELAAPQSRVKYDEHQRPDMVRDRISGTESPKQPPAPAGATSRGDDDGCVIQAEVFNTLVGWFAHLRG